MRILSINKKLNNRYSFKAIRLSEEETASANKLLAAYTNADSEKELAEANEKLFLLLDKHIQPEAELKAKGAYNPFDVLQNMYLVYLQTLSELRRSGENLLSKIIEALNNYKPSKQDLKDGYDKSTVSIQTNIDSPNIKNDGDNITLEDTFTREDLPVPLSPQIKILNKRELDIVEKKSTNYSYRQIAAKYKLSYTRIRYKYLSAIAKLQKKNGTLPEEYEIRANKLKEIFSLKLSVDKITDILIKNIDLLNMDINEIENRVNDSSKLLGIPREAFINAALKQPMLFNQDSQITNKKVNDSSKLLGISREEFINAALKYPSLFYQDPQTTNKKVNDSSKLLGVSREAFIKTALKHPSLFYFKPKTLNKKINKLAELFNIDRATVIQRIMANPSFLTNNPQYLKLLEDINKYYKKLQGESFNPITFESDSLTNKYSKILAFLINKKAKIVLVPRTKHTLKDLRNFLTEFSNFTMTFEVPDDKVLKGLIEFTEKMTTETIDRNPFKFIITDNYNPEMVIKYRYSGH